MQYAENELGIIQHHLPACLCVSARRQVRDFAAPNKEGRLCAQTETKYAPACE